MTLLARHRPVAQELGQDGTPGRFSVIIPALDRILRSLSRQHLFSAHNAAAIPVCVLRQADETTIYKGTTTAIVRADIQTCTLWGVQQFMPREMRVPTSAGVNAWSGWYATQATRGIEKADRCGYPWRAEKTRPRKF